LAEEGEEGTWTRNVREGRSALTPPFIEAREEARCRMSEGRGGKPVRNKGNA